MHERGCLFFCVYMCVCTHYALQVWFTGFQARVSGKLSAKQPKENQQKVYEWR